METITVFTPTYNRAYCLNNCYESLCRQTNKDFIWLVIDDGSEDNTNELVNEWRKQTNSFIIKYVYKQNEGLYSGYTTAFKHITTDLCMCVDSDDYLKDDAIEKIQDCWKGRGNNQVAGIVGLDCTPDGEIIGDPFPDQETINLIDIAVGKYKFYNGDRKNIVRTELYREAVSFDSIPDEKDFNPHYLHLMISKQFDFLVLNEPLCVVNYQKDGMTATVLRQYVRSPKSFRIMRQMDLSLPGKLPYLIKKTIHYDSSCILSGEACLVGTPHRFLALILYPAGLMWTIILKRIVRRQQNNEKKDIISDS